MILNDAATELKSAKIVKKMTKNKHKLHKPGSPRRLEHWQDRGGFDPPPHPLLCCKITTILDFRYTNVLNQEGIPFGIKWAVGTDMTWEAESNKAFLDQFSRYGDLHQGQENLETLLAECLLLFDQRDMYGKADTHFQYKLGDSLHRCSQ